tara:strand:+ start:147 stop:641 length:495 start_codon:yes stop_codon:yes gene_type:complete
MTLEAITTFIRFSDSDNTSIEHFKFQNSTTTGVIDYVRPGETNAEPYDFLPFIYSGATKSVSGDNIESSLTFAANPISIGYAQEARENGYLVEVNTVLMTPTTFAPSRTLTTEYWIASGLNYNVEAVQLSLSSSIDAVSSFVPNKVLLSKNVGALPVSSRISNV